MHTSAVPATGSHTTNGLPHGFTSLTPHLVVSDAEPALGFYAEALGAHVAEVTRMGDLIAHAVLDLERGRFTLSDAITDYGLIAPDPQAGVTYSLGLYVRQVDEVVERAVAAGATLREPVSTFVSGDRYGSILDPFGVRWSIMTRVVDLSPEESARRVEAWAAGASTGGE